LVIEISLYYDARSEKHKKKYFFVLSSPPNHGVLRPDGMAFIVLIQYQMVILCTFFPHILVIFISVF